MCPRPLIQMRVLRGEKVPAEPVDDVALLAEKISLVARVLAAGRARILADVRSFERLVVVKDARIHAAVEIHVGLAIEVAREIFWPSPMAILSGLKSLARLPGQLMNHRSSEAANPHTPRATGRPAKQRRDSFSLEGFPAETSHEVNTSKAAYTNAYSTAMPQMFQPISGQL